MTVFMFILASIMSLIVGVGLGYQLTVKMFTVGLSQQIKESKELKFKINGKNYKVQIKEE